MAAIVLKPGDVPAGFTPTPYHADPRNAANQAALVTCVGGRNTAADKTGDVHSPDFHSRQASISSEASRYRKQADLTADVAIIRSPKISACYDKLARAQIAASLPAGATVNGIAIKITPRRSAEPHNVVGTGTGRIKVTANGQSVTVYLDVAFITGPRIEAEIDFENIGRPIPAATRTSLIAAIARRAVS